MPPKAPRPKAPQKKTSKPKQDIKTTQENADKGKTQSLLDMKKESVESVKLLEDYDEVNFKESKLANLKILTQKRDSLIEKAIAELDLEESFSEESEEEESEVELPFGIIEHPSKFIKCDDISGDEEEEEEEEVLPQEGIDEADPFFNTFGGVPELDDLSDDESMKEKLKERERKASLGAKDKGKFVNPLTGYIVLPPDHGIETISVKSEPVEEKRPSKRPSTRLSTRRSTRRSTRYSTEKAEDVDEDESEEASEADDHDKFLEFLELETQKQEAEHALEKTAIEDLLRQQMERVYYEQTLEFLNGLIDSCVDKAEYVDENIILRKSLDKNKLMIELKAKLEVVETEKKILQFLNRKCSEFFRRRSAFGKLISDYSAANYQKYYDVLKNLDDWLKKEKEFKKESVARLEECREEYEIVNQNLESGVQKLEQLIKSTLYREKFDKLKAIVFQKIEQMSTIRKKISEDRTKLLILQHDGTILRQQLKKLEDLGNGLYIKNYETLETETSALDKKVEERNNTMKKLYNHLNCDIHNLAHLKEKQKITRQFILIQKQILNELQVDKQGIRKFITELKISKNRCRYEIRQKSFQCGLLDKPILMRDYDRTEISINNLRISNDDLKNKADDIIKKIAQLEDMNKKVNPEDSNENPQNIS